jgi:hypothetical protein
MRIPIFNNFARTTLANGISSISGSPLSVVVASGTGGVFPSPTTGHYFPVVLTNSAGYREVMYCTSRSGDVLTCTRAQEGTSALTFVTTDIIGCRLTAGALNDLAFILSSSWISVKDFGATGDGVTDDTVAIQAAHDSLGASGGALLFPMGTYLVSAVTLSKQCELIGVGAHSGATYIRAKNAASIVFNVTTSAVSFSDMCFDANTTQSGGAYIQFDTTSSIGRVRNVRMLNWYRGVVIKGGGDFRLNEVLLTSGVPVTGQGVRIDNGTAIYLAGVVCNNADGSEPDSGFAVTNCGDITMIGCQAVQCVFGLSLLPGSGQVITSVYCLGCLFDNSTGQALRMKPLHASGAIHRHTYVGCWFSSTSAGQGALLDTATVGGAIDGVEFVGCEFFLNSLSGLEIEGTGSANIRVNGGKFAQNGVAGIVAGGGVSKWSVVGATIGACGGLSGNTTYGVQSLPGISNDFIIAQNTFLSNGSSPLSIASTGARRIIVDNVGYDPAGTSAITVTASPFTYTAGDTAETITINGGTVSLVSVAGVNVFQQTNCTVRLGPGVSAIVTYSSAPGMTRTLD